MTKSLSNFAIEDSFLLTEIYDKKKKRGEEKKTENKSLQLITYLICSKNIERFTLRIKNNTQISAVPISTQYQILPIQGALVRSLVGGLRSHLPCSMAKNKNQTNKKHRFKKGNTFSLYLCLSRQEYQSEYHSLLQGIFLTHGLNPSLLHCRQILYHLSHQGSHLKRRK